MMRAETENVQTLETEVAVIGGGGAGLAAAVAAAEQGARVVLLEKQHAPGGSSAMATGFFAADSPAQRRLMIDAPRDELFKKAMTYTHWKTNPRILRAFIDKSGETVAWLERKGLEIECVPSLYPNQVPQTWHWPKGHGAALVGVLTKSSRALGVTLLARAAARKIVTDRDSHVSGVSAETSEGPIRVNAGAVVVATGGYAGNRELLRKYCPMLADSVVCTGAPNMGDGIAMATEVGAATEGLGLLLMIGASCRRSKVVRAVAREPVCVMVNSRGERFFDESLPDNHERGNPTGRQPGGVCYALFDEGIKRLIIENGLSRSGTGLKRRDWFLLPELETVELEKDISALVDTGDLKVSVSWPEIAQFIGAGGSALQETIDEYNGFCDHGHDALFVKEPRYLVPLRTPPFYAVRCFTGLLGTVGGIRIDHGMRVLDPGDNPIPGLYAAGVDTGGWQGDTYGSSVLPGMAFGFAINSGRIAGENAAAYVRTVSQSG